MLKKTLAGIVAVLLLLVGGYALFVDALVSRVIEAGVSDSIGVEAHVGFARLRLFRGDLRVRRLRVANPPGFDEPDFVNVAWGRLEADPADLRNPVVEIPLIVMDGVDVKLERADKRMNYEVILDHLDSFESGGGEEEGSQQRFVVRRLSIRNVDVHYEWSDVATNETRLALEIPEIELRDLGEEGGGITAAELSGVITKALLGSIAKLGGDLPGAVIAGLNVGLRDVGRVSGVVLRDTSGKILESAGAVTTGVGDALKDAGQKAADAIGGFLGRGGDE